MENRLSYLNTIIAILTLLITVILVRGIREWIVTSTKKLVKKIIDVSSLEKTHFLILLLTQLGIGATFIYYHILSPTAAILFTVSSMLSTTVFWYALIRQKRLLDKIQTHINEADIRGNELARNIRVQGIMDKWSECLEVISHDIPLTATDSLLRAAILYDVSGNIIILTIPKMLYPTYEALKDNISKVESIIESVYNHKYSLKFITRI